ncbi:MAG: phosphohydrolase [Candidatus Diapherotrites archaeon]|nr:phosphohydrolase [Candidatus Diapherotrites archaeon]
MRFNIPVKGNKKLGSVVKKVRASKRLAAMWKCSNVNSIDRLGYNDHGPVHIQIVANAALQMLRLLVAGGVKPSIVKNHKMTVDDAEVVVVLAASLHDIGMTVHRHNHELFSIILAPQLLPELLGGYSVEEQVVMQSEILHALPHYSKELAPFTVEAGVVRVADATDMSKGRSRIPFDMGKKDIHAVSAQAIDDVSIKKGTKKPVKILVKMNNSAGVFQLDQLLRPRIALSGLGKYIEVEAVVQAKEKHILTKFTL